jgi:hypothetical protein
MSNASPGARAASHRLRILLPGLLAALPLAAAAQTSDFDYNWVEGGYQTIELDGFGSDGEGFFVGGSFHVIEPLLLTADYDYADFGGVEADTLELGVGVPLPVRPGVDAVVRGGYVDAELDTRFGDFDDDGLFASAGVRWMASPQVELNGAVAYRDLDESGDDVAFQLGGLVSVTPRLAVQATLEVVDDTDTIGLGLRYYLGPR